MRQGNGETDPNSKRSRNSIPEWLWAPLSAGLLTLVVGAMGLWADLPWLFPSLAPTIYLQVHKPEQQSSRPYHVIMGHAAGVAAGVIGVLLTGAGDAPPVTAADQLSWSRVWASAIGMGLTLGLEVPLKASHPAGTATALLIALGAFKVAPKDLGIIAAGVIIVAVLGEGLRRLRAG